MKLIHYDESTGELKLQPQSLEDLWVLSRVVSEGSEVEGSSLRRFKAERGVAQRAESGEKKPVRVRLAVRETEFAESANKLRFTGVITWGEPEEFVQLGGHHTLDVEIAKPFKLFKRLSAYDKHLLAEARDKSARVRALVVLIDEEHALAYLLDSRGLEELFDFRNSASKRTPETFDSLTQKFFSEVLAGMREHEAQWLVVAGPGFTRDSFKKFLSEKTPALSEKAFFEHASSAEKTGALELLKRGLLEKILGRQKLSQEFQALEAFKASVGRGDGLAAYGTADVKQAVHLRAVKLLMVLDEALRKDEEIAEIVRESEQGGTDLLIFDSDDDAGKEFASFKIAALLRYRTKYE